MRTFVTSFFTSVSEAAAAGAGEAEAEVDGEIIAEEMALSAEFAPLAIIGLVIAALTVVFMILSFGLSKTMTAWIRVFNDPSLPVAAEHRLQLQPRDQTTTEGRAAAPARHRAVTPWVKPTCSVIYRADYVLQNDNTWEGLGVVIQAPPSAGCPGLAFAIDFPASGRTVRR